MLMMHYAYGEIHRFYNVEIKCINFTFFCCNAELVFEFNIEPRDIPFHWYSFVSKKRAKSFVWDALEGSLDKSKWHLMSSRRNQVLFLWKCLAGARFSTPQASENEFNSERDLKPMLREKRKEKKKQLTHLMVSLLTQTFIWILSLIKQDGIWRSNRITANIAANQRSNTCSFDSALNCFCMNEFYRKNVCARTKQSLSKSDFC